MLINNKQEARQFIKDYSNSTIYYYYEYELSKYFTKEQLEKLMKKYNVSFIETL